MIIYSNCQAMLSYILIFSLLFSDNYSKHCQSIEDFVQPMNVQRRSYLANIHPNTFGKRFTFFNISISPTWQWKFYFTIYSTRPNKCWIQRLDSICCHHNLDFSPVKAIIIYWIPTFEEILSLLGYSNRFIDWITIRAHSIKLLVILLPWIKSI